MMGLDKLYAQAVAAQKSGNLVEAELRYREILDAALIPEVMVNHANVLAAMGRRDDALADYSRALAAKPDLFEALYNRGNLLLEMKRADAALAEHADLVDAIAAGDAPRAGAGARRHIERAGETRIRMMFDAE